MDKTFLRNFITLVILLAAYVTGLGLILVTSNKVIGHTDADVTNTYDVISEAQEVSALIERMLSSHRAFIGTFDDGRKDAYEQTLLNIQDRLEKLKALESTNPERQAELERIQKLVTRLDKVLDIRTERLIKLPKPDKARFKDVAAIEDFKDSIVSLNQDILQDEYTKLNKLIADLQDKRDVYFSMLLLGGIGGAVLLLVFNTFLFQAHSRRVQVEESLRDTEQRMALAIEGTMDAIYDWDIKTDQVFFSRQFFKMLGHDRPACIGTSADGDAYVNPDDLRSLKETISRYMAGELPELNTTFRMKHAEGNWIWVNSRGKAIFDPKTGQALRLVGALSDITYVREYQDRLKHEKAQADKANRAKSDFLAHMSHEIRTPLTAISGIAEIFDRSNANLNDKQKQLVKTLYSSTAALKDLINDILDFSKIESGELELDNRNFVLGEMFDQVVEMMSVMSKGRGLDFNSDYEPVADLEFFGDAHRLRQILVNLVGNAVKFTEKGSVTVTANIEGKNLVVKVIDTGIGIPTENLATVFEKFKQGDSSVSRKYGGTGLGLPISKNLAQLMGGDITVESEQGKGSMFMLTLPVAAAAEKVAAETVAELAASDEMQQNRTVIEDGDNRILLAEDYDGNIVVLTYILDDMGCKYDVARTGKEALQFWQQNHYDLILMDIQMPEVDGFTATKMIRKLEAEKNLPYTPIIGMTAHALMQDKDSCIQAGMDWYLSKPVVEADLKAAILKFLNRQNEAA